MIQPVFLAPKKFMNLTFLYRQLIYTTPGIDLTGIVGLAFLVDSILKLPVTIAGDVDGVDVDGVVIRDEAGSDGVIEVEQLVRARIFDTEFKQIKSRTLFLTYNRLHWIIMY